MQKMFTAVLLGAVLLCTQSNAEGDPPPFKEFSFKRVKVGESKVGKRITVQIDPAEQARALAVAPKPPKKDATEASKTAPTSAYGWYWELVSPTLAESGPARLQKGLRALSAGPGGGQVATPRLDTLRAITKAHGVNILTSTVGTQVSPALVVALISVESGGRIEVVSHAGAEGLMQLIPDTAKRFGVTDSTDPAQNIKGGVAYLAWLMKEFDNDPILALAGYNAGENAVKKHQGVPPFAETRDYVPKVLAAWTVARLLCVTPPELVTDGCVFAPQNG